MRSRLAEPATCHPDQLTGLCKTLETHPAIPVLKQRMSVKYWSDFRHADSLEERKVAALKQDMMEDFFAEIQGVLSAVKLEEVKGRESK